jgi:hypothetical protein
MFFFSSFAVSVLKKLLKQSFCRHPDINKVEFIPAKVNKNAKNVK